MTTSKLKVINNDCTASNQKKSQSESTPIRIKINTKAKIDELLKRANKNHIGRKVKADDLICFSFGLLNDTHLEEVCSKVLTNKDRLEILFNKLRKENRNMDREKFYGMLLEAKLPAAL